MTQKFEIVETADYILAVSDEEIQTGYYYNDLDNELRKGYAEQSYHTSVIAYAPKGNALELEGLPLLPEMGVEDDVYNEEDLRKALDVVYIDWYQDLGHTENTKEDYFNRIIQSLRQAKKPKYFVAEMELNLSGKNALDRASYILKTTEINGKTYSCGYYLYE
jgi:hypothetical protein